MPPMLTRLDHIGIVAPSWDMARGMLIDQFGLEVNESRTSLPDGNYYRPGNTRIFFVTVALGETDIEVLIPQDDKSGIARYMARRGPGLHHLCYASTDPREDARLLRERGLEQISEGGDVASDSAPFFHPRSALGILTEIVRDGRLPREWPATASPPGGA
jgi:methylmalonyl-CoA/ethylmalonyl-CoA epimerase